MTQHSVPKPRGNRSLWAVIILSVIGLGLSLMLTHEYYQVRSGDVGFRSFCNVSKSMNCDAVAASRFAELVGGIPLSSFASGWFLALAIIGALSLSRDWRKDGIRSAFAMACLAGAMSIGYFAIMALVLKTYCLFCLMVDGVSFALVAILYFTLPVAESGVSQSGRWKTVLGVILGSVLVTVLVGKSMDTSSIDTATMEQYADSTLASAPVPVGSGDEFPAFGPKDAPVTIVEFSDFQCPYCRIGAFTLNSVLNRYPNQVRLVFRAFPLDSSCNPLIEVGHGHTAACEAARVAFCARKQGKFETVYEDFFQRQTEIAPGKPAEMAKALGVNPEQLSSCVNTPEIVTAVTRDIEEGKRLGVQSTPTFFINGHKVEGAYPAPIWNLIIERLLAAKKSS